jgi:hypothetical protein
VSSRFWSEEDRARAERHGLKTKTSGFITVEAWNCTDPKSSAPLVFDDFEHAVLQNGNLWRPLESQMESYFKDHLHPFPYEFERKNASTAPPESAATPPGEPTGQAGADPATPEAGKRAKAAADSDVSHHDDPWYRRMLSTIAGFRVPGDFFQVHLDMINRRDKPNGVDGDIRGLILVLRYVYGRNLWRLIKLRRSRATKASALILLAYVSAVLSTELLLAQAWARPPFTEHGFAASQLMALSQTLRIDAGPIPYVLAAIVLATIFYVWSWILEYPKVTTEYQTSINASCANVRSTVVGRFDYLRRMTEQMHEEVPKKDKYKEQWQKAATRWSKLGQWISMRAQHLESFFQLEMWRIRRMEAWLRFIGYGTTVLTLFLALLSVVGATLLLTLGGGLHLLALCAVFAVPAIYYLFYINRIVFRQQRTGRSILEDNLGHAIKPGAGHTEQPELSAQTISAVISRVRELENFLVGVATPTGRHP